MFDVVLSVTEHSIDQSSKMASHGNDCFASTKFGFKSTVLCSEHALAMSQALSAKSQGVSSSVVDFAGGSMEHFSSGDGVVRTYTLKRAELFFSLPFQLSPKALLRHARRSDYIFSSKTLTILRTYDTCFRGFKSARLLSYEPGSMILIVTLRTPQ